MRAQSEQELMSQLCPILTPGGVYRLAWVGAVEHDQQRSVRPLAWTGFEDGYMESLHVTWADSERGRGPTGTAARTGLPVIVNDTQSDANFLPWREQAIKRGYRSVIGLPMLNQGQVLGVITIYAAQPGAFNKAEQNLLLEMAEDLAYGLVSLRTRAAQRQAEASLRESQASLEAAQALGRMGSWRLDLSRETGAWSKEMFRMFQCPLGVDAPPLPVFLDMVHPDDRQPLLQVHRSVIESGQQQIAEYRSNPECGEVHYYETRIDASIDPQGHTSVMTGTVIDITRLKRAQLELEQLNHTLEQRVQQRTTELVRSRDDLSLANAALEKAARLKDEFLASMSHELRTPLTGILGLSEALQLQTYGPLSDKQIKALKNIEGSGRHLLELINDILDLSKIEAGRLELQMEDCSMADICQASLQLVKGMANQRRQSVGFSMNTASLLLHADPRRLKQILVNLLSNAIKFTPEGGKLGLEVDGDSAEQVARLTVWDRGIGIRPEDMGKLFHSFVQIDSSLSRQYAGTGLGLALVQKLSEMHGGRVEVSSVFGEGSRFTVVLPWVTNEMYPTPNTRPEPNPQHLDLLKKVLTIEDSRLDAEQISRYLAGLKIENLVYPAARGALEKAAAEQPDLVLLDLHLPDGSGMDILVSLRGDPRTRSIPVIIISTDEQCSEAHALGAVGYLVKPITQQELHNELARVSALIDNTRKTEAASASAPLVMLADDNEVILETLTDFLESQQYRVLACSSGSELLERAQELCPDLVMVDIQMPGMDGIEVIRRLRASPDARLARVPIMAVTALAMVGDKERILTAGADDYMSKPISLSQLGQALRRLLEQSHAQAQEIKQD
ncbi:MAG: response regulator [Chloroflexota bacterium]